MMRPIRLALVLMAVTAVTPPLMLWQAAAVRTGLLDQRRVPRLWHRMVTKLLGFRVHVRGEPAKTRPLLIASNHVSWTDIVVLSSLADLHFIAKSEVAGWPIMGTLARLQRSIFVERDQRRRAGEQAGAIAARLSDGDPMVLFAEGTTGDGNFVLPFKSTLFAAAGMALAQGEARPVTVQPVAIAYTRLQGMPMGRAGRGHIAWIGDQSLMPHLRQLASEGAVDIEVHFGEPVEFGNGADRKQVAREVEARVRMMMTQALRKPL